MVSSLFSIKAAHWRDGIRGTELGARGKERTARQRRVVRVKGCASRGEGASMSTSIKREMKRKRERRTRILNGEATFELLVICYRCRRAASAQGYGRARHACPYRLQQNQTSNFKHQTSGLQTYSDGPEVAGPGFVVAAIYGRDKEDYSTIRMVQKSADKSRSVR